MAIELLIDLLDVARILADQHRSEIFDGAGYRPGLPLQRGLTPAKQTRLVGDDLYKYPIPHLCVDDDGLNIGNLHRAPKLDGIKHETTSRSARKRCSAPFLLRLRKMLSLGRPGLLESA